MKFDLNTLYNMDCMEAMKDIPDKYFELAIVDPPYGIDVSKMNMGGRTTVKPDSTKKWDEETPTEEYFNELERVSKNQIIWGGNYFGLRATRCFVIWDKGESMYGRSFAECEYAWTSFDKSARILKYNPMDLQRIHPTQKPKALYKWLLANYANEGDKILDTHAGSCSLAIACYEMGHDWLAFELDEDYFAAAQERIKRETMQGLLFNI